MRSKLNYHFIAGVVLAIFATADPLNNWTTFSPDHLNYKALIECDREPAGRRIQASGGFQSPCGSAAEVSARIGKCLGPIFLLVEGRFEDPKGDEDITSHCQKFNSTERCIRGISKDCLSGIHKTSVSAVASATKRFRTAECKSETSRARYIEPLKCVKGTGKTMTSLYRNYTSIMQSIRDLPIPPEQKLVKTCCTLNNLDRSLAGVYDQVCPKHTAIILSIVHAMTDDARSTLCINPKCNGALNGIVATRLKQEQNFIEPIMQVLFELSDS